jgi:hypothetical protein
MAAKLNINTFDIIRGSKVVDFMLQGVLIALVFYSPDKDGNISTASFRLVVWVQLLSLLIQLFVRFRKKRKVQRLIILSILGCWQVLHYLILSHRVHLVIPTPTSYEFSRISATNTVLMFIAVPISFWYMVLCFAETKYLLGKKNKK